MKHRVISCIVAGALASTMLTACAGQAGTSASNQVKLDPSNPVNVTVWHYYNGAQQAAFDQLVAEFNATTGKDEGIHVEGYSQGSVGDLEKAVTASVNGEVGSQPLPDVFSSYADTAYGIEKQGKLADLKQYFTDDELSRYVDSYVDDGYFDNSGALYLLPVAKSTEIMMLDKTDWEPFAQATGTSTDELSTLEGVSAVAKRYYEWTDAQTPDVPNDGKAFYGRDSMSNYFVVGMKQMGVDIFDVNDGAVTIRADKDKVRRLWDNYYVPYVSGYFAANGKFRSDDVKTGEVIAYTGSSSSAMYFPDQVITDDSAKSIDYEVLPVPVLSGGDNVRAQQGAGMAVAKSDEQHEYAASEFLKWFTAKDNSLRFVCESAYLPVLKEANSTQALDQVISDSNLTVVPKAYDCLTNILDSYDSISFYATQTFDNGCQARKVLDCNLSDKAKADRASVVASLEAGESLEEAVAPFTSDAAFDAWYDSFMQALRAAANKER